MSLKSTGLEDYAPLVWWQQDRSSLITVGTAVDPKVKGGLVVCLSGLGDDGRNSSPCHAP